MIEENVVLQIPAHEGDHAPCLVTGLGQADRTGCFPLVQGADMASPAKTDAFLLRQIAYAAD